MEEKLKVHFRTNQKREKKNEDQMYGCVGQQI